MRFTAPSSAVRRRRSGSASVLVAVALYRFAPSFYDNVDLIVNRIPCFIFGVLLGRLSHERRPLPMPVVAACLTAVAVMLYPMQLVDVPLVKVYLRAALNLLLCICGVVIMDVMARAGKPALAGLHDVVSKVLSWFGRYSLELYLLHVMIRKMLNLNDPPTTHLRYEAFVIFPEKLQVYSGFIIKTFFKAFGYDFHKVLIALIVLSQKYQMVVTVITASDSFFIESGSRCNIDLAPENRFDSCCFCRTVKINHAIHHTMIRNRHTVHPEFFYPGYTFFNFI